MKDKKITLATLKSFLKKNEGKLFIKIESEFDGMTDSINSVKDSFTPLEINERNNKNNLGFVGVWLVGNSRDYLKYYENDNYSGIEVYNCCGCFIVAIKR